MVGSSLQENRLAPIVMGLGMASAFALLGLATGVLAESIGFDTESVRQGSAMLMIVFGLAMTIPQAREFFVKLVSPIADRASALST